MFLFFLFVYYRRSLYRASVGVCTDAVPFFFSPGAGLFGQKLLSPGGGEETCGAVIVLSLLVTFIFRSLYPSFVPYTCIPVEFYCAEFYCAFFVVSVA